MKISRLLTTAVMVLVLAGFAYAAFCPNCGKEAKAEHKFCAGCGKKLSDAKTTPSAQKEDAKKAVKKKIGKDIAEANVLFENAQILRTSINPIKRRERHFKALKRYQDIIDKYPKSDKLEMALYWAGKIYEGVYYKKHAKATEYYRKVWERNPDTETDVRWRVAVITEKVIKDFDKAISAYQRVVDDGPDESRRKKARERIDVLKGK
jgi:TolA-binding protein